MAYRLNLSPLSLSPADEIANEKPLQSRDQRHPQDEKNARNRGDIEKQHELRTDVADSLL
jgi:hypothetical protein